MLEINNLSQSFPGFSLNNISLTVNDGEFFALLGPTGSGKTVLLESIAGLEKLKQGRIIINGRDVTSLKPEERNISIVYQDYALFPNMKVQGNIRYGLRFRKKGSKLNENNKFDMLVEVLKIEHLLNRYPHNLSGGEKQRVALARALMVEPDVLLLDEPFSALDSNTKETVQLEIKKLHDKLKTTTLMVTHNFSEVFSLAERVAIIKNGVIQQVGTTVEIFKNPNSRFTAHFVGMKNIYPMKKLKEKIKPAQQLELDTVSLHDQTNLQYYAGFRGEDIVVGNKELNTDYQIEGKISAILNNGIYTEVRVQVGDIDFIAYLTANRFFELNLYPKKQVFLGFNSRDINIIMEELTISHPTGGAEV